jgi:ribosome biogenesis GTPase
VEESAATIHELLPRKSKFVRKAPGEKVEEQVVAANIDNVFLVTGLDGDYNLKRLERYLVLAWESGANPVVILNKIDLCGDLSGLLQEVQTVALQVPILTMSALGNEGVEAMRPYLGPGLTGALLGSSGVGKSTIINQLLGEGRQKVKEVRATDSRGRHATTQRELIPLPFGGLLMDTPGMRELQLWGSGEGFDDAFEDVLALARQCRFRDCRHLAEPGCAVRSALESGALDTRRHENYLKLQKEIAYQHRKSDLMAELKEKSKWKKIHAAQKRIYNKKK